MLFPNGSLREDHIALSITWFPMRSLQAKYLTSSPYRSQGGWVPTSPTTEARDKENILPLFQITPHSRLSRWARTLLFFIQKFLRFLEYLMQITYYLFQKFQ